MSKFFILYFFLLTGHLFGQITSMGFGKVELINQTHSTHTRSLFNDANGNSHSQRSTNKYPEFIAYLPKGKYEFGAAQCWSVGLSTIDYEGDDIMSIPFWKYNGPLIETGIAIKDQKQFMCNKVGYEYFFLCFGGRANLVHYTDFSNNQFYFRPEIGASLFSLLTFTYGYNVNLSTNTKSNFNGSIFSLNLACFINKKEYRTKK